MVYGRKTEKRSLVTKKGKWWTKILELVIWKIELILEGKIKSGLKRFKIPKICEWNLKTINLSYEKKTIYYLTWNGCQHEGILRAYNMTGRENKSILLEGWGYKFDQR